MRTLALLASSFALLTACPGTGPTDGPGGKTVQLTVAGVDFPVELPAEGSAWGLVEGGGQDNGAFGRTMPEGTHATTLTTLSASSCDSALAGAKQSAGAQGKELNAADRPQWLPSRYWPVGLEGTDGDVAVWLACLDTKRGPLGALTTVRPGITASGTAPHAASAPHVKLALERVADAALAAAVQAKAPPDPSAPPEPTAPTDPRPLPPG